MSIGEIKADDLLGLVGRELGGRYRLDQFIDRGGFGAVYRGLDKRLNQPVAVKVGLSNREFMREARLAAEVRHDNIVHVTDFGDDGGLAYLVMEFLEGENLEVLFKSQGNQLSLEQLRKLVRQVGAALAHAHGEQLIHRDLKPRNIILKRSSSKSATSLAAGKFVLLDFGIAAKLDATGTQRNRTRDGAGTVEYMAPELLTSSPQTTPQSDIYGFGTILYQMMAGRVPFPQKDNSHLALATCLHAIATEPPPPFSAIAPHRPYSAELQALVLQCLEKDPAKRPQSVMELVERFRAACPATTSGTGLPLLDDDEEEDGTSRPGLPPEPAEPGIFDHWTWLVTAAACAVILAIAFWPQPPSPGPGLPPPTAELTARIGDDVIDLAKAPLSLLPGDAARVTFRFDNLPPDAAPLFEAPEVPQGVEVQPDQGVGNAEAQTYTIRIPDPNVTLPAEAAITFRGRTASGAEPVEIVTRLDLRPPVPWLPESLKTLGFSLPQPPRLCRIEKEFFPTVLNREIAGKTVRFRLVPERTVGQRRVRTFYVMEGLVTNRMFHAYALDRPERPWKPDGSKERTTSENDNDFPVTDIVPLDAHGFAQWIGGKNATLPTTTEWDIASGYYEFLEALDRAAGAASREIPSKTFEAFRKKPVPVRDLNYSVLYGLGPDDNEVSMPDGSRMPESSPFGCRYPRSAAGTPVTELTATLLANTIITELQRVAAQSEVTGLYRMLVRGVGEDATSDQRFCWAVRDGETVSIVPTEDFDRVDPVVLAGNTITSGPDFGFRVVLHTVDASP